MLTDSERQISLYANFVHSRVCINRVDYHFV